MTGQVTTNRPFLNWNRWDANKHLVNIISNEITRISQELDPRANAQEAFVLLNNAIDLHTRISSFGINLIDGTNIYQNTWRDVIEFLLTNHTTDYEYFDLINL